MSKRKTKKEKLQSAERVRIQQEEYARLLKQKVDLREYKEGLLIRQDEMRRNFIAFELGLVCLLTSFFQVEKSFLENRKETTYRIEKIETINRSDQATLYAEYEYLDETKTVTIPITKEEKDSLAKQLKIFLSVLGLLGTPGIYAVSVNPYRSDINELKSRIRKLQKEQDKN